MPIDDLTALVLEIHWQESAEGFAPEGYAKGVRGMK